MKTQLLHQLLFVFILVPTVMLAGNTRTWSGKHTKEKTIKKDFTVSRDATLKVDNSFGNIDIITYEGSVISIEVFIM